MTYYPVQSPYHVFMDTDGDPLENGYIYIGEAYQNPITNPITIYWDENGVYPAAQPLRTIGGYIDRNGSPSNIFINNDSNQSYSILVKNKHLKQVYYTNDAVSNIYGSKSTVNNLPELRNYNNFNNSVYLRGHTTIGDGGGDFFEYFEGGAPGTYVDDNGSIIVPSGGDGSAAWIRQIKDNKVNAEGFGIFTDGTGAMNVAGFNNFISSDKIDIIVFRAGQTYDFNARLTFASNKSIYGDRINPAIFDFAGVLGIGSGESRLISGENLTNIVIQGIDVRGDATDFVNNGFDTYGIFFDDSSEIKILDVIVRNVENGVSIHSGCNNCLVQDITGIDCFYHSISSRGLNTAINTNITFRNILSYGTSGIASTAPIDGFNFEETYDSTAENIICHDCKTGIRIENSCDNKICNVTAHSNYANGMSIYNFSQRNVCENLILYNNNRANEDAIDNTTRGNNNTKYSGLNIEGDSSNNLIQNVTAFQTAATEIPFTSGSDEPVLGSLIGGVTSGETARVRRIEITSGSWVGNDAAGTFFCVEPTGAFNASEVIQNLTTIVPYNSGSLQPDIGDTIEGATSGATGTILWTSQQSATDWSDSTSSGYLYLINVVGTFNGSENLNNTTKSENNFATNNSATTPVDTDIATTNGVTTLNSDALGFQKYGIGINVRNLSGIGAADGYNNILNYQCLNNDIASISDRGYYNSIFGGNSYYGTLRRN